MIPFFCPVCLQLDEQGLSGHATNRCKPVTKKVVTRNHSGVVCNHCVTKDAEIERLRNQLVEALKAADEKVIRKIKVKRDRAAYMRNYRKEIA